MVPLVLRTSNGTIAPFGIRSSPRGRVLELLGSEDSDYAGLVAASASTDPWDEAFRELSSSGARWDMLHFHSVRDLHSIASAARRHFAATVHWRVYDRCPSIRVAASWDAFLASRKKLRYEVRRWERRLAEAGEVRVETVCAPISQSLAGEMTDVERHSWKWDRGNAALRDGSQRAFLLATLSDAEMPADVWCLRVNGQLIAYAIVLTDSDRWYFYMTTYRSETKNAGSLLLARIVQRVHESGICRIELLRGDHEYKEAWADDSEPVYELVARRTWRGTGSVLAHRVRWWAARSNSLRRLRSRLLRIGDRR